MSLLSETTINNQPYLSGTVTAAKQNNVIDITTAGTYTPSNIRIAVNVTRAILTSSSGSNTFDIQVPNGDSSPVVFHFSVDDQNNTTVTSGTVS